MMRVRRALRRLLDKPSLLITGVVSLCICFGVNTALLSFLASVLWLPQPRLTAPGRLVTVLEWDEHGNVRYPTEARLRALEQVRFGTIQLASYVPAFISLGGNDGGGRLTAEIVSADYFRILGVGVRRGRVLASFDTVARENRIPAVISARLWHERFGSAETTIGSDITLQNRERLTIVGIAPEGFHGPERLVQADVWLPTARMADAGRWSRVVGRLAAGATPDAAAAELRATWPRLNESDAEAQFRRRHPTSIEVRPLRAGLHPESNGVVRLLLGGASVVALFALILTCANLGGLEFSRSLSRQREIAVRRALGEGVASILVDVAMDLLIVFTLGALGGLLLAPYAGQLLVRVLATPFPFALGVQVEWHTATAIVLLTLVSAAVSALVPALRAARADPSAALRADTVSATTQRGVARAQSAFVAVQVALALGILSAALSAIGAAREALTQPIGVASPSSLVVVPIRVDVGKRESSLVSRTDDVRDVLLARLGASSAAFAYAAPGSGGLLRLAAYPATGTARGDPVADSEIVQANVVTPGFFATTGQPLLDGRDFSASDGQASERVAIVSRRLAADLFGRERALDRRFAISAETAATFRVIGLADDIRYDAASDTAARVAYFSAAQFGEAFGRRNAMLRLRGPLTQSTRRLIDSTMRRADLWRGAPETVDELRASQASAGLAVAKLLILAAALCVILVVVGLFGLVSHSVRQRVREIGVRLALGASVRNVVWLFTARVGEILLIAMGAGCALLWLFEQSEFLPVAARPHIWFWATVAGAFLCIVGAVTAAGVTYSQARQSPAIALRDL